MNVHFKDLEPVRSSERGKRVQVLVFKTNLRFRTRVKQLAPILNAAGGIIRWNVDHADIDNVLRIETIQQSAEDIIRMVTGAGYLCEELPD
jgi:hypothetical protein